MFGLHWIVLRSIVTVMQSNINESVTAELRAVAGRQRVGTNELADRLNVSTMWVSRRLRDLVALTLTDLVNICEALEADPVDVLAAALKPAGAIAADS